GRRHTLSRAGVRTLRDAGQSPELRPCSDALPEPGAVAGWRSTPQHRRAAQPERPSYADEPPNRESLERSLTAAFRRKGYHLLGRDSGGYWTCPHQPREAEVSLNPELELRVRG